MIQLTFQPSLDPFHAMFRLLRLRSLYRTCGDVSVDHARIIDFYFVFPFKIEDVRLRPEHRRYKKLSYLYLSSKSYGNQPEDKILFERMLAMQVAAMETLGANGYLHPERLRESWISFTAADPAPELRDRIAALNSEESDLLEFLSVLANDYVVPGVNGLKHRTGLMEHRYDVV
jgi:hypothetical protein